MRILGIETSCDETGVAIYDAEKGLIANVLHSQIALHAQFGGVVPELASRDHIRKVLPLIHEALGIANIKINEIDAIAYAFCPGLVGALLVGAAIGQSLGFSLNIPTIAINHLEAHILAIFLEELEKDGKKQKQPKPEFPFLALLASGGHTQLVEVKDIGKYKIIGETLDDAAGEAFDKVAKILGLPYPGGALLSELATKGNPERFNFPRPMINKKGLNFSFSGLKTFASNTLRDATKRNDNNEQTRADIALAFQEAITETLVIKCKRALNQIKFNRLVLAGGVSANHALRHKLHQTAKKEEFEVYFPPTKFCTDNGAMIAYAGYKYFSLGKKNQGLAIHVLPRV